MKSLYLPHILVIPFFSFIASPTTALYTLSLHDALPILLPFREDPATDEFGPKVGGQGVDHDQPNREVLGQLLRLPDRSEEHTSELQSRLHLVCRLLLEKKKIE